MALTTLRTVINRVLTAVGETPVAAIVTDLTTLVQLKALEFINQIKEEIEEASQWRSLRQTFAVTVAPNTNSTAIAGTDERARVIRIPAPQAGQLVPLVFDVTAANNQIALFEIPLAELLYRVKQDSGQTVVQPDRFAVDNTSGQCVLYVYPTPNTSRSISIAMHVPQATLVHTDLDTGILTPTLPLIKGAIWYIQLDRGEEMGPGGAFTEERYRTSLDDAIARDNAESGTGDQLVTDQIPWWGMIGGQQ